MVIDGVTGVYKKTYLNDDTYRMDYLYAIDGYYDDETGKFYDNLDNEIPFIRDVEALESKENKFHNGFISYEDLAKRFATSDSEEEDDYEDFLYQFDQDLKNKMLLVSVLEDEEDQERYAELTEIDYENIRKNAMRYYIAMKNERGEVIQRYIDTIDLNMPLEELQKLIKKGSYSLEELKLLKSVYEVSYESIIEILKTCDLLLVEEDDNLYQQNIKERKPNFNFDGTFEIDEEKLIDMLEKHILTIDEVRTLYDGYTIYKSQLEEILESVNKEIDRIEQAEIDENIEEQLIEIPKRKILLDNIDHHYSLDDLKSLRNIVTQYLVGQDEPLRQFTLELSRMKDKEFKDNVGILLSGDSGVGKTYMVELVAECLGIPFVKVDSTSLTTPGYVGRDLEEVIYELYEVSGKNIEKAEHGMILFDEIDKKGSNNKDDISGKAVLNHILTLLDGSDIYACKNTKGFGSEEVKINSKHMIIIAAGSFPDVYKDNRRTIGFNSADEIDEPNKTPSTNVFVQKALMSGDFINRLPNRIRLNTLTAKDFENNFRNGKDSPIKWEEASFGKNNVQLKVTNGFIRKASQLAMKEDSGFRGAKGVILRATSNALDDVKEHPGKYSQVILSEKTLGDPKVYKRVLRK